MCKKLKGCGRKIDPCMRIFIGRMEDLFKAQERADKKRGDYFKFKIVACCCGHKKYNMSIVVKADVYVRNKYVRSYFQEFITGIEIERKRNFYKKDKQGYYYIPEVVKNKK